MAATEPRAVDAEAARNSQRRSLVAREFGE